MKAGTTILCCLGICLILWSPVVAQAPPRSLPLNLLGIGIGMTSEAVCAKVGAPVTALRIDNKTGMHQTSFNMKDARVDLFFKADVNPQPLLLKRIVVTYQESIDSAEFGIKAERMYFNDGFQYYTYRKLAHDEHGTAVLMVALGEERGRINAFNLFAPEGLVPPWQAPPTKKPSE